MVLPMNTLLTVEQLSACIHKSVASIRSDASRNPRSLPPLCRLPGTKRLLWRPEDVEQWLVGHVVSAAPALSTPLVATLRRGRPTKAEQMARQRKSSTPPTDRSTQTDVPCAASITSDAGKRKRGRPTKAEQVARQRRGAKAANVDNSHASAGA